MTPDAQRAMRIFVASQKTAHGYMNAGGHEDAYYGQFGQVLEAVFSPFRLPATGIHLSVPESRKQDTVYGRFFVFLEQEMKFSTRCAKFRDKSFCALPTSLSGSTTNAVCCVLAMQHQMGMQSDETYVKWLQQRQDESGGFRASEEAPIPDLLSTAVALFTLRLLGATVGDAMPFVQAHWLESGGFAPTLLDDYSDVEYIFYGLLALGCLK